MKSTRLALALVVLSSTIAFLPVANAAKMEGYAWGAQGAPIEAAAGDTGKALTVLIRNNALTTYSGVKATIGQGYYDGSPGIVPSSAGGVASLGANFAPGDIWNARFTVDILPQAYTFAPYGVPVTLEMYDRTNSTFVTEQLTITVQITGRATLDLTLDTTKLVANAESTIRATIRSAGSGPAGDVRVTPTASQGIALLAGDSTQNLGSLRPGQTANVTLRVKALQPGSGTLTFALSYTDAAGSSAQSTRQKTLQISGATEPTDGRRVSVRIIEQNVDAGSAANVTFLITNNGTSALRDVQAKAEVGANGQLVVPDASDQQGLGDIPPGSEARMTMRVITDNSDRGIQRVPLTLSWTRDDDTTGTRTFNLAVPIVGTVRPSLSGITATVNNQTMATSLSGTITNAGNTAALSAYIELVGSGVFRGTQPQFLGDLSTNTGVPFTIPTELLNASLLTRGSAIPQGAAGHQTGEEGGRTFPSGGSGFPDHGGAPEGADRPGGGGGFTPRGTDGARSEGGFGGFRGASGNAIQLRLTWTDEFGAGHAQILTAQATLRNATTGARTASTASADPSGILSVPSPGIALLLATIVGAGVALGAWQRTRRG